MSPAIPQLNVTTTPQLAAVRGTDDREPVATTPLSDESAGNFQMANSRLSRSLEIRASFYSTFLTYIQQFTRPELNIEVSRAFKAELASLFESFAKVLRNESSTAQDELESDDLRKQLVDAKDQIIALLTERATDQARITQLETELKFLPDLQAQADRAMTIADSASKVQDSLADLRLQLNDAHLHRMRHKLHRSKPRSWWGKFASHFAHSID